MRMIDVAVSVGSACRIVESSACLTGELDQVTCWWRMLSLLDRMSNKSGVIYLPIFTSCQSAVNHTQFHNHKDYHVPFTNLGLRVSGLRLIELVQAFHFNLLHKCITSSQHHAVLHTVSRGLIY